MDDGAVVLSQELKYSVGVRNLELEHLRDKFSAADSIDGDDISIRVAAQPGNNQLIMATLNDQCTHQIPTTDWEGISCAESWVNQNLAICSMSV